MKHLERSTCLAAMLAALAGCGGGGEAPASTATGSQSATQNTGQLTPAPTPPPTSPPTGTPPGAPPPASPPPAPVEFKGVVTEFRGTLAYEGAAGGGIGDGADGDGGIGAGGSLGQFRGAEVYVFLKDGTELGHAVVGETSGLVTIKPGRDYVGPLLVEVRGKAGAQYFDEAKKAFVDFGTSEVLRARVSQANRNIGITPLTEAATAWLQANPNTGNTPLAERIDQANSLVGDEIGRFLPANYRVNDITLLPVLIGPGSGKGAATPDAQGTYAVVLAALPESASQFNPGLSSPALSFSKSLALDLTDGQIDARRIDGRPVAEPGAASYGLPELGAQLTSAINRAEATIGDPTQRDTAGVPVSLNDPDFPAWTTFSFIEDDPVYPQPGPGTSEGTVVRSEVGGNPGAFLRSQVVVISGDNLSVGAFKGNYTYSPQIEGPIASVDVLLEVTDFDEGGSSSLRIALQQDGKIYLSVPRIAFDGDWQPASFGQLTANDFELRADGSQPDFGSTGLPIRFGYRIGNVVGVPAGAAPESNANSAEGSHGVDNYQLTINRATN
ncbi:MAG: hypothetical protein R3E68_07665 [Burkholderiaceae bacterium]